MAGPKSLNPIRAYRPDCDGIRFLAIVSVVLYHAGVPLLTGGFTGVDIFFVISGYLIGGHIFMDLLNGAFSFSQFYRRRAKRILPAFFLMLIATLIAGVVLLSPYELTEMVKSGFAAALSASNIYFWRYTDYFASNSELNPLLMTWSLGVEEQFYILIPISMVLLAQVRRKLVLPAIVAVCVVSFFYAMYAVTKSPLVAFYMLPARAWELGAGVTLAVMELRKQRTVVSGPLAQWASALGSVLVLAPITLLSAATPFPGAAALPSVLGTALIIASPEGWINRRILSLPLLVFIGRISYSWYLWHWPVLSFFHIMREGKLPASIAALAVVLSLGAAIASYYAVEQPFRKSERAAGPLLIRYGLLSLALLVACAGIWLTRGLPQRSPQVATADYELEAMKHNPCLISSRGSTPRLSAKCYDPSAAGGTVALWGDSHSAALAPGLRDVAKAQGYGFAQLGQTGCLPLIGAAEYRANSPEVARNCMDFNHNVLNFLQASADIKMVVLVGFWERPFQPESAQWLVREHEQSRARASLAEQEGMFVAGLETTIQSLQASDKQVILMNDVPSFAFDPHAIFRNCEMPLRHKIAGWLGDESSCGAESGPVLSPTASALTASLLDQVTKASPGIELVDLRKNLCNEQGDCAYQHNRQELYIDAVHLSDTGAHYVLRDFHLPGLNASGE